MTDPMQDDVAAQVAAFAALVRRTFDPSRYPKLADGRVFDAELREVETSFADLKHVFHDYLVATWAEEAVRVLKAAASREKQEESA